SLRLPELSPPKRVARRSLFLRQSPPPSTPDEDPSLKAGEAWAGLQVLAAPPRAAGRGRGECREQAPSQAHPARSPTTSPKTARRRDDQRAATNGRASPWDPPKQRIHHRRLSSQA